MTSIAMTARRILGPKPWKPPQFDMPFLVDAGELSPLGKDKRGRSWFGHALGEFCEGRTIRATARVGIDGTETEDAALPNAPIVQVVDAEGARTYRTFNVSAPGTYAAMMDASAIAKPAPLPPRPVDALAGFSLLSNIRGCSDIEARIRDRAKTSVVLDGEDLIEYPAGGRSYVGVDMANLLGVLVPLMAPYLRTGTPPQCWAGCGREAVTVARGRPTGRPWCGECEGVKP